MKIRHLWVSKYKNIDNVDLYFDTNQLITLLIGQNGLGKSNLIEILALIFRDLQLLKKEDEFLNWPFEDDHFEYKIEYLCRNSTVKIHCLENNFDVWEKPIVGDDDFIKISFSDFQNRKTNDLLPKYVIGYYSGESQRLKGIIRDFEELYWGEFLAKARKPNINEIEDQFRGLFFAESFHSQLILLTLALYQNDKSIKDEINSLFSEFINVEEIRDFTIEFNNPDWSFKNIGGANKSIDYLISNIQEKVDYPFWNLSGKADQIITHFYNHQIERFEPYYYTDKDQDERSYVNEFLGFEDIIFDDFSKLIRDYYPEPIDFFDALESTNFLGVLNEISFSVIKAGIPEPILFEQLSEGEQQLISVLGLILIAGKEDCLFLLDEPDTHLNPQWQRDYIQLLKDFNLSDENSQIFVATHSPLLVQSIEDANTVLFRKVNGKVKIDQTDFKQEGWRIDQVLASDLFGLSSTRPPKYDDFYKVRNRIVERGELTDEDRRELIEHENIFGAFPTGETIKEIETMALLSRVAKQLKEKNQKNK